MDNEEGFHDNLPDEKTEEQTKTSIEEKKDPVEKQPKKPKTKSNPWKIATILLIVALAISIAAGNFGITGAVVGVKEEISKEKAASETLQFVNQNLLQGQNTAKLKSVTETDSLYLLKITVSGRDMDTYVTKDGKMFFPQGISLEETVTPPTTQEQATPEVTKSDKPTVDLYVMSHCPYGTQAEKGMLPVAELLGDKIDFNVKFVYYAMHGKKELDEQMRQVCIQEEQLEVFNDYLVCFLDNGESESCLQEANVNKVSMESCVQKLDQEYKITEQFNDKSTWLSGKFPLFDVHKEENQMYGIKGSPGLVINGAQASSARSPDAYLQTVCAAFNDVPEECEQELSATTYSAGFGYEAGVATAASCG